MAEPDRPYLLPGSYHRLPCGCEVWTQLAPGATFSVAFGAAIVSPPEAAQFLIRPHDLSCEYYQFALKESAEQGKPIQIREE